MFDKSQNQNDHWHSDTSAETTNRASFSEIHHMGDDRGLSELLEDPNQHLWAISYADLLMVLLAFFVVFDIKPEGEKNLESKKAKTFLAEILQKLPVVGDLVKVENSGADTKAIPTEGAVPDDPTKIVVSGAGASENSEQAKADFDALIESLKNQNIELEISGDDTSLLIHFPKSMFKLGQYEIEKRTSDLLRRLAAVLVPYRNSIQLTAIGHADNTPLSQKARKKLGSNMILSSLRAAKAAEVLIKAGIPERSIATSGLAQYGKGSRTLSLRIQEIETKVDQPLEKAEGQNENP